MVSDSTVRISVEQQKEVVKDKKNVGKPHEKIGMTLKKEYWKYSRKKLCFPPIVLNYLRTLVPGDTG